MKPPASQWSEKILSFLHQLTIPAKLPSKVEVMNPYQDAGTFELCRKFYRKYYADNHPRTLMVGINPGRFGSGTTGISFTDPLKLEQDCGIANTLPKKPELSADFIYRMIHAYGGPKKFYERFFISAVSPLGFTRNGTNINYYDDKKLESAVTPFVLQSLDTLVKLGVSRKRCFCIGENENLKFLDKLNRQHHWFETIVPLPHPRFIMQYRRKTMDKYIDRYLRELR